MTPVPESLPPPRAAIIGAFAVLYVVWGSTYLGIAYAIETIPPFLMAGTRFMAAGALVAIWLLVRRTPLPSAREWGSSAIVGVLLILCGNGGVTWAEQWVPSGITALLIATTPLWMSCLPWLARRAPRPAGSVLAGIGVGLIGMVVLFSHTVQAAWAGGGDWAHAFGVLAILGACLAWSWGSLWSKALPKPASLAAFMAMQMLCGGAAQLIVSAATGELARFHPAAVSAASFWAWAYLVVIGAIVGFGAFVFLLRWRPATQVATYAYVNPVVAVLLGWLFRAEPLTIEVGIASALIVPAVALIVWKG